MKLKQLVEARGAIEKLTNQRGLPAVTSLRLARFWRTVRPEIDAYEQQRVNLVQELGEQRGEIIVVKPENVGAFNEQITAMQEEEIAVKFKPFDMADFQHAGLSVEDIFALEAIGLLLVDWDAVEPAEAVADE